MNNHVAIKLNRVCLAFPQNRHKALKNIFVDLFTRRQIYETQPIQGLSNLNLEIVSGERVAIIGSNGSGKSSLLKVISKIYAPSSGEIQVYGRVAPILELGGGFQPDYSGRENIYLNCSILGIRHKEIKLLEKSIINFAGIGEAIDRPVRTYSAGMYLRLAFSIATSIKPEILIIDEILSAGDLDFANKAKTRIRELISSAKTFILVSHDFNQIKELTQRAVLLKKGHIVADGSTGEVLALYKNQLKVD